MDMILQKLQAFVKGLQEKYNSLSTPLKFLVGLALFTLLPCVAVCSTKWKGWVKALVCFFLFSFMLAILMYAFVFYLFWFIWKKTNWKTNVKVIVTTALIVVPIILGIAFGTPAPAEKTPSLPGASSTPLDSDNVASSTPPDTADSSTQQSTGDISSTDTQPPAEEREMTPYLQLAEDENAYLLFLRIIGTCYKDNTLTVEIFNEMAENSDVQMLVQDVLDHRYQNGTLSPDFVASFSAFWNDNVASAHQDVIDALKVSFDLEYNFVEKVWILKENEATVAAQTGSSTQAKTVYTVDGIDYYDFEGLIEVGTVIYLRDGAKMTPFLEILDFGTNKRNEADATPIPNAIYVKEQPENYTYELTLAIWGRDTYWKDLGEMLRHNKETRENGGDPVYYVRAS